MHTVDLIVVWAAVAVVVVFAGIIARQRAMMRTAGAVPIAFRRGSRWLYGIGRYRAGELQWYRAFGVAMRPTRVLRRGSVEVLDRRERADSERGLLPSSAVVIRCRADGEVVELALGTDAFTGFVSWLESSAPMA